MRYLFIHYHLLPGGVTTVLLHTIKALHKHASKHDGDFSAAILCGRPDNTPEIKAHLQAANCPPVDITPHPALDYSNNDPADFKPNTAAITEILTEYIAEDTIWWIHNYHLGKNCALTAAIIHIARTSPRQRILLHIHDFPEHARPANLRAIDTLIPRPPGIYPQRSRLLYCTINPADHARLTQAFSQPPTTPAAAPLSPRATLLQNPINIDTPDDAKIYHIPEPERTKIIHRLHKTLAATTPDVHGSLHPDSKYILYPIRTIRRKNVFEAGLLAAGINAAASEYTPPSPSSPPHCQLIVTLPGLSPQERGYSQQVAAMFASSHIAGAWGVGTQLQQLAIPYPSLVASAHALISTSVQEGFGYTMVEALLASKPLICRYIPPIDMCRPHYPPSQLHDYTEINIPWTHPALTHSRDLMRRAYQQRIDSIADLYTPEQITYLQNQLEALFADTAIDYSYLSVTCQQEIIRTLTPDLLHEINQLNGNLFSRLYHLLQHPPSSATDPAPGISGLISNSGYQNFAAHANQLLQQLTHEPPAATVADTIIDPEIDTRVRRQFLDISHLRLLTT